MAMKIVEWFLIVSAVSGIGLTLTVWYDGYAWPNWTQPDDA